MLIDVDCCSVMLIDFVYADLYRLIEWDLDWLSEIILIERDQDLLSDV